MYLVSKETDKYVEINTGYGITKEKKFLCMGGDFAGQKKTHSQVYKNYRTFNATYSVGRKDCST